MSRGTAYPAETTTPRRQGATSEGPYLAGRERLFAYYVLDRHVTAVEVRSVPDSVGIG